MSDDRQASRGIPQGIAAAVYLAIGTAVCVQISHLLPGFQSLDAYKTLLHPMLGGLIALGINWAATELGEKIVPSVGVLVPIVGFKVIGACTILAVVGFVLLGDSPTGKPEREQENMQSIENNGRPPSLKSNETDNGRAREAAHHDQVDAQPRAGSDPVPSVNPDLACFSKLINKAIKESSIRKLISRSKTTCRNETLRGFLVAVSDASTKLKDEATRNGHPATSFRISAEAILRLALVSNTEWNNPPTKESAATWFASYTGIFTKEQLNAATTIARRLANLKVPAHHSIKFTTTVAGALDIEEIAEPVRAQRHLTSFRVGMTSHWIHRGPDLRHRLAACCQAYNFQTEGGASACDSVAPGELAVFWKSPKDGHNTWVKQASGSNMYYDARRIVDLQGRPFDAVLTSVGNAPGNASAQNECSKTYEAETGEEPCPLDDA